MIRQRHHLLHVQRFERGVQIAHGFPQHGEIVALALAADRYRNGAGFMVNADDGSGTERRIAQHDAGAPAQVAENVAVHFDDETRHHGAGQKIVFEAETERGGLVKREIRLVFAQQIRHEQRVIVDLIAQLEFLHQFDEIVMLAARIALAIENLAERGDREQTVVRGQLRRADNRIDSFGRPARIDYVGFLENRVVEMERDPQIVQKIG